MKETFSAKEAIVSASKELYARGLMPGGAGNISLRIGNEILITPSGVCKGRLSADCIVRIDMAGGVIEGGNPTTELPMHMRIYELREDVGAIVHIHGANTVAMTVAGIRFQDDVLPEIPLKIGKVATSKFAMPSTPESADVIEPFIKKGINAVIIPYHGIVALGKTIRHAVMTAEAVEYSAEVQLKATSAGGIRKLRR